ncbi:MAG: PIG-L family deacetylase [Acidobacteria bacterium]|nr:PIG-L family deacetylase [Acidobacteriota bacterium]MBV9474653.1 PIG-L family deacetylase [Acidobacteriota bacterium]
MRRLITLVLTLTLTVSAFAKDAAQLRLQLRKLTVLGSALYVAAHPDDENTAMLAWLANDRCYRTGYLSMTRGDGGQNLIGDEKGPLLGIIRTQELLAARRIDGAEQMFTRALDFGYSKNPQETLATWGHDAVLADVVWAIRKFQPDVLITRFPITGEGGHGHHTASAMLAEEAFTAAGDATKFPEQLQYVSVWQPKRIFWNRFSFGKPIDPNDPSVAKSLRVDLGAYSPLLGRAYTEIAAESRSQHKSQGFGSAERRGSFINYYDLRNGAPAQSDLFEGIDTSWSRYPGGEAVGRILQQAANDFDGDRPQASLPLLLQAWNALEQLRANPAWTANRNPWLAVKRAELLDAIRDCAGIAIDVSAGDSAVVAGGDIPVTVNVVNRSDYPFRLSMVASLYANPSKAVAAPLENNKPVKTELSLRVPADAAISQPYWLRETPAKGLYHVDDRKLVGMPENPLALPLTITIEDAANHTLIFTVPAIFRWTDPVAGEKTRNVDVVPDVTANLASGVYVFPDAKPRPVTVALRSFGPTDATVRLALPASWSATPASTPVKFSGKGDETRVTFTVTPPANASTGDARAEVTLADGRKLSYGLTEIEYPHIPAQRVFNDAGARLVRADIQHRGNRIGYIMGSGDEVPNILRQIGYDVTLLTDADLDRGDFSSYDAVVTGVRAYNTRKRLKLAHEKLMQYVANGGTVVVQYNTTAELTVPAAGPYPFKISGDRVTVEEAPIRFVDPNHPLLTTPNKITAADFEGWVQERGLYFTNDWDAKYATVLASNDPGESEKAGGELYARHGKGVYIYTSYAWWRQLAAGVPGAIRAFVNLVSAK